ncbi:MAG: hypothetical protein K8I60_12850, partial [Anaerolineae bacterium]|nr:hypothetical protein [Anaerolineae bacterium]
SVTALAVRAPLLVATAMDGGMYDHVTTRANLRKLAERGVFWSNRKKAGSRPGWSGKGVCRKHPL